ncbi:MAG: hypothetical protein M3525_10345 [Acidobacteriota bacterium]|nr:hypothetical protein [Acidobacteriota bacterium]
MNNKYQLYLQDLGFLVKERALSAKTDKEGKAQDSQSYLYEAGRLMAFNEIISLMQQQAEGFEIDLSEINLGNLNPDQDLL